MSANVELLPGESYACTAPDWKAAGGSSFPIHIVGPQLRYHIVADSRGADRWYGIACTKCEMVSWNSNDVANRYCGHCHEFLNDVAPIGRISTVKPEDQGLRVIAHNPAQQPMADALARVLNARPGEIAKVMRAMHAGEVPGYSIERMAEDPGVSVEQLCAAAIDEQDARQMALAGDTPQVNPDGLVEIFDEDAQQMVMRNNDRRFAGGFDEQIQREAKGPIR